MSGDRILPVVELRHVHADIDVGHSKSPRGAFEIHALPITIDAADQNVGVLHEVVGQLPFRLRYFNLRPRTNAANEPFRDAHFGRFLLTS